MTKHVISRRTAMSIMLAAAPVLSGSLRAAELPGAGRTIRLGRASWDTFWFGGLILSAGLEKLGYKIAEPKTLDVASLYQALAQGDVDYTPDIVLPNANTALEKIKDSVTLVGPIIQPGSVSGFLIDKATSEKHNIAYIEDFRDPKVAAIFGDGDRRARMIGPNPGWNDDPIARNYMKRMGVEKNINMVQGEYTILIADTVARYKAGKPVMIYAWYPNAASVQLRPGAEMVWLQVKPEDANPDQAVKGMSGCSQNADPCNTGWNATSYMIAVNNNFAKANPAAMKFFSLIKMTLADRAEQNTKMMVGGEKTDSDLKRHASEWIKRNQAAFDSAVAESLAAK